MKFKTKDQFHQESECGRYRISHNLDAKANSYFVCWHKGECIGSRRVPNFREDRLLAVAELTEIADQHAKQGQA